MKKGNTFPDQVLTAITRTGGILRGAYKDDQLIGFTLGWLGAVKHGEALPYNVIEQNH